MVGASADDTNADTVLLIPSGVTVNNVDAVSSVKVVDGTLAVDLPDLEISHVSESSKRGWPGRLVWVQRREKQEHGSRRYARWVWKERMGDREWSREERV